MRNFTLEELNYLDAQCSVEELIPYEEMITRQLDYYSYKIDVIQDYTKRDFKMYRVLNTLDKRIYKYYHPIPAILPDFDDDLPF